MSSSGAGLYILIALLGIAFVILWVGSLLLVSGSVRRRRMKLHQQGFWLGLAAILPVAGALAYGIFVLVSHLMNPAPVEEESVPRRVTQPMPALRPQGVKSTIPAMGSIPGTISIPAAAPPKPATPASLPHTPVRLVAVEGPEKGQSWEPGHFPILIGRSQAASILLSRDLLISRRHAEIYEVQGLLHLRDLASLHGTRVNGRPVQDTPLAPGDRIQVGDTVLVIQPKGA